MKTDIFTHTKNKKILIICSGSIAVVKIPLLVSNLIKEGAQVKCLLTDSAAKLVSATSLATLSRNRCYLDKDQWEPIEVRPLHIELAEWPDIIVLAPLSASTLSKWIHGIADNLAISVLIAAEKPIIAAAAMNTAMWTNQAIKENWLSLQKQKNILAISPSEGLLACDRRGTGRMIDISVIQLAIEHVHIHISNYSYIKKDLTGIRMVVTAGATMESIDSARLITNNSSGIMGTFLAQAARFRGAHIDFIYGSMQIPDNFFEGLNLIKINNAQKMHNILNELQIHADVIAMVAAIADIRIKEQKTKQKLPKNILIQSICSNLELVSDLLIALNSKRPPEQLFLGFAALAGSNEEVQSLGKDKMIKKGCDVLMANPIDRKDEGFGSKSTSGWLFAGNHEPEEIKKTDKMSLSNKILDEIWRLKNLKSGK